MHDGRSPARFAAQAHDALGDAKLRRAVASATELFRERRAAALAGAPDWEGWRRQARAAKDAILADLPGQLESFARRAAAAGAVVHRARDAEEANSIVLEIARRAGPRIVKSKSMTTEETGLNAALEAAGLAPVETDLGEYIIQLAGEAPSHIIVPAIHKSRGDVAALFARHLGSGADDSAEELTAAARAALRARFAEADVGISGVNFAVVETGSILVLENEGNARMTTSLPRVHVAVMGQEKLVPKLEDLAVFLRLLPRSGTGQVLTSYQSLFTGPAGPGGVEGPDELHIVILDNGRAALAADPGARDVLACIRCGACLNACPVYREIGGHAYGTVYPGPIGAVLTPQMPFGRDAGQLPWASSLCGACQEACPVGIELPDMLLRLRARQVEERPPRGERFAFRWWAWWMSGPRRYALAARALRAGARLAGWKGGSPPRALRRLLPALRAWSAGRDLPPPARRSFRSGWFAQEAKAVESRPKGGGATAPPNRPDAPEAALGDVAERFCDRAAAAGAQVHALRGLDEAADRLAAILARAGVRSLLCSDAPLVEALAARLDEAFETLPPSAPRERSLEAEAGLTSAAWAVAETGTLLLDHQRERNRLASLLPPVHVAVLGRDRILPALDDVLRRIGEDGPGPALTLVTGPSRTADIELQLVTGVHGPRELHLLLLEES